MTDSDSLPQRERFSISIIIDAQNSKDADACDVIATRSGLSKSQIKDAMNKGAVTLRRANRQKILRRAKTILRPGDQLQLNYDAAILAQQPLPLVCIADERAYSVWNKPAGMLAQGTLWGDHCALLRLVEQFFQPPREVFLVHRLDREAAGLMLIAHNKLASAKLSQLFQTNNVYKAYRTEVRGCPAVVGESAVIDFPLDGKPAHSEYRVLSYDDKTDIAQLEVVIRSGRKHQIRRHLDAIAHPVMGDPRYGQHNKTPDGMRLVATTLEFDCPLSGRRRSYRLPGEI
jgi:tRNA pseudouridine32 synthase/23S rRNA pseudouridine746 synthase